MDSDTSDIFYSTCACFLVELDVSKDLPEAIFLDSLRGSWTQMLDFEGIPFRCKNCHLTGHIAARCVAGKSKSRQPPSWWSGASFEHYIVKQSLDTSMDFVVDVSPDVHLEPVVEEVVSTPILDALPKSQLLSDSHREIGTASMPLGFHCSISSKAWVAEAAKIEDGWIVVKSKRSKPYAPPLDMNLLSCKGNFKSKGKS